MSYLSLKIYGKSGRSVNHQLDAGSKVDFERDKSLQFIVRHVFFPLTIQ